MKQYTFTRSIALVILSVLLSSCATDGPRYPDIDPPVAPRQPVELTIHDHTRIDSYYWINERDNPEVIAYIEAENEYLRQMMAHTEEFQNDLFEEMRSRIKEDDETVPYKKGDYYYYTRYVEDKEYPVFCRRKGSLTAPEEIIVDGNELGEGKSYFAIGNPTMSYDHTIAAFAVDTVGRRFYTAMFKDMRTGEILPHSIADITGNLEWANDNKSVFYSRQHPVTLRPYQIFRYELGKPVSATRLVYEEKDETYRCFVTKTKSEEYIVIYIGSTLSTEQRVLNANNPSGRFTIIQPREHELEYSIVHFGDLFYIRTNDRAPNFKLVAAPVADPRKENWIDVIPHRDDILLERVDIFNDFLVVQERSEGLPRIRIRKWDTGDDHYIDFGEPTYSAFIAYNPEYNTEILRYSYTSLTTPNSVFDYNMRTREKVLMKQQPVLGDFSPENYLTERLHASADDGTKIPMSVVYRKSLRKNGKNPALIYGYGSYGASSSPYFNSSLLSLLDRGFVFAIAHVRGGQEMGRQWYEEGKLLKKINTFTDFIDCSEYLIAEGYTASDKLFASGGSAGGLLIGAVINMRPDLYNGVIASVPFVDVVTTMLDDSIPLTTAEYDEWGNPNDTTYYEYMLSYSPYDNLTAHGYPHMLVTSGLHDSQVQYWEPTKWVAKLRTLKTDNNALLLYTNMDAGHSGASGRFQALREVALEYAFILDLAGKRK
jgi:oligopeptidase B